MFQKQWQTNCDQIKSIRLQWIDLKESRSGESKFWCHALFQCELQHENINSSFKRNHFANDEFISLTCTAFCPFISFMFLLLFAFSRHMIQYIRTYSPYPLVSRITSHLFHSGVRVFGFNRQWYEDRPTRIQHPPTKENLKLSTKLLLMQHLWSKQRNCIGLVSHQLSRNHSLQTVTDMVPKPTREKTPSPTSFSIPMVQCTFKGQRMLYLETNWVRPPQKML